MLYTSTAIYISETKMSLLQVRRIIHKNKRLGRGRGRARVKPVDQRISALWDSPMAIWEPQE